MMLQFLEVACDMTSQDGQSSSGTVSGLQHTPCICSKSLQSVNAGFIHADQLVGADRLNAKVRQEARFILVTGSSIRISVSWQVQHCSLACWALGTECPQ